MKYRVNWRTGFVFCCAVIVATGTLWTADPDVFWHLKVGEWIVAHHSVPRTDIYSWSAGGRPWTAHQWAWEVLLYEVYRYTGMFGLWFLVFLMGATAGLLVRQGLKARGVTEEVATVAGGMGTLLLVGWLRPWPQAGVYALFAAYLLLSLRDRWGPREVFAAAGMGLLWANIHSTATMFPLLLAAEAAWTALVRREATGWRWTAAAAAGLGTLVNPHGVNLWMYAVREGLLTQQYRRSIGEWMPYDFGALDMTVIFLICMVILFTAARQGREKDLEFWRAAGFWVLALMSRIYMPYAVLSTAVVLGLLYFEFGAASFKRVLAVALACTILIIPYIKLTKGIPGDLEELAANNGYPVKALRYIQVRGYEKIYNDYGWGGYLIWKGVPVYIDGRADVYKGILTGCIKLLEAKKPAGRAIRDTGAETVLTRANGKLDAVLKESPWWREVYRDKAAVIYRGQA